MKRSEDDTMRLKYEPGINGEIVIRIKEDPVAYYDECTINKFDDFVHRISAYYSEKGELIEIRMYTGDLEAKYIRDRITRTGAGSEEEWKRQFEQLEKEVVISDVLPSRRYVFMYGKDDGWPKGCVDHYTEIHSSDIPFMELKTLKIWRLDGKEMNRSEIAELRTEFFEDAEDGLGYGEPMFINSTYRDKKLYFWEKGVHSDPSDILDCTQEIFEEFDYTIEEVRKRDYGGDIIVTGSWLDKMLSFFFGIGDESVYDDETDYDNMKTWAFICICYNEEPIGKEELIKICKNINNYKNRGVIIDLDIDSPDIEFILSKEAVEYLESQNIGTCGIGKLITMRNFEVAETHDGTDWYECILQEIFDDD